MRHNVLNSPRLEELKKNRRKKFKKKILIICVGILILLLGFGFLTRIPKLNIQNIQVTGSVVVDTEDIQALAEEIMAGHYFWLVPKTNVFFYPKKKIRENLEHEFNRLKDVEVELSGIETLEISVAEREGVYTWCGKDLPESIKDEKCFFLDEDGYIFDESPYFSGEVYFKFYGEMFQTFSPVFDDLIEFKENLEMMKLRPVGIFVGGDNEAQVLLSVENTNGANPKINFRLNDDFTKMAENLQSAISTEPLLSEIKNNYSALQYIDLRYGNKVYYRFR